MDNQTNAVTLVNNDNYIPQGGGGGIGKANLYCDTTPILCPGTYSVSAVKLVQPGNRIAISVGYYDDSGELKWIQNNDNNSDYWHISKDQTYASTAPIMIPEGKICQGIRFIQSGNQLAYLIFTANPDGSQGQWIGPENHDPYIPGSLENMYMDTNEVVLQKKYKLKGFRIWKKGNRIAPGFFI